MADSDVQVPPDSTGKLIDTSSVTTGVGTAQRQRVALGDGSNGANIATVTAAGALKVDGSAVTQPVSVSGSVTVAGSVTVSNFPGTQPVSGTVSLTAGQGVELIDSGGTNKATISSGGALKVDGSAVTQPVNGTVTSNQGTANTNANGWTVKVTDGTNVLGTLSNPIRIDPTGTTTQPVSGTVTAEQGGPPWSVSVSNFPSTQPVSWTAQSVELLDSGGTNKATISAGGALKVDGSGVTQPVSGTISLTAGQGVELIDSGGTNKASISAGGALKVDGSAVTQPVSGTVSLSVGQAVELLDSGGTNKASISAAGAVKVDGSAVTQPVSGGVTATPATFSAIVAPFQTTVAVTNTAVQLASHALSNGVIVRALTGNSANPFVIGVSTVTTANGYQLAPGESVTLPINNTNLVYINGTIGDGVSVIGV